MFSGGTRQSNDVEHNGLDLGLFPISGKSVQVRDTSEFAIYVHSNGPRHIPSKAKTPSTNRRHLAAIIPRAKFDSGSLKSRKNKNYTSKKKKLKQKNSLFSIIPSKSHHIFNNGSTVNNSQLGGYSMIVGKV